MNMKCHTSYHVAVKVYGIKLHLTRFIRDVRCKRSFINYNQRLIEKLAISAHAINSRGCKLKSFHFHKSPLSYPFNQETIQAIPQR